MGINEENSFKWLNYNHSHLLCPDLSQCWLENIRMTFSNKNDPARCRSVTLPFHQVRTDPEVSVKEENYAFLTLFFQKVYKSRLLLLVDSPSLIDTLLHSCKLGGSFHKLLWRGVTGSWYRNTSTAYFHS